MGGFHEKVLERDFISKFPDNNVSKHFNLTTFFQSNINLRDNSASLIRTQKDWNNYNENNEKLPLQEINQ